HDVILELHNDGIVAAGSSREPVEATAKFFGCDGHCRRSAASTTTTSSSTTARSTPSWSRWRNQRRNISGIRLSGCHVNFKKGPAAARLYDLRRGHHSAEVLPTRVGCEDLHVAHDVFAEPRFDVLDDVLLIHVAIDDVVFAGRRFHSRAPGE